MELYFLSFNVPTKNSAGFEELFFLSVFNIFLCVTKTFFFYLLPVTIISSSILLTAEIGIPERMSLSEAVDHES